MRNEDWRDEAACLKCPDDRINSLFWPVGEYDWAFETGIRQYCSKCPVRIDCLEYALKNMEMQGLWGGKTPKERAEILVKRGKRGARWTRPPEPGELRCLQCNEPFASTRENKRYCSLECRRLVYNMNRRVRHDGNRTRQASQ